MLGIPELQKGGDGANLKPMFGAFGRNTAFEPMHSSCCGLEHANWVGAMVGDMPRQFAQSTVLKLAAINVYGTTGLHGCDSAPTGGKVCGS